jgi:hypothetical protein
MKYALSRLSTAPEFQVVPGSINPTATNIKGLQTGDYMKISLIADGYRETFWVEFISNTTGKIKCKVANDLIYTEHHGLDCGHLITILPVHILSILKQ